MTYIEWLRSQVGHRKILLPYASVLLHDDRDRVLLQHRTDFDAWGLPGGCLEPGESILNCARRELLEETGLTAGDLQLVGVYSEPKYDVTYPNGDEVQQFTICFQGKTNGGEMRPDGIETNALQFFAPEEIPFHELLPHYADMIRQAWHGEMPAFGPPCIHPPTRSQIQGMRAFIGSQLFIGVGAIVAVVREDGRILLTHRTDDGEWDLPGGYMDLGENVAQAAARETHEETGLEVEPTRLLGIHSPTEPWIYPNGDMVQSLVAIFRARVVGGRLRADQVEASSVEWFTPEEILKAKSHPAYARLKQAVIRHLESGYFIL
jgi:8-oxo-dGTP diphosphatase